MPAVPLLHFGWKTTRAPLPLTTAASGWALLLHLNLSVKPCIVGRGSDLTFMVVPPPPLLLPLPRMLISVSVLKGC